MIYILDCLFLDSCEQVEEDEDFQKHIFTVNILFVCAATVIMIKSSKSSN
jgi:hypothetical protein